MAITTRITDDLTGADGAITRHFVLNDEVYEIDLTDESLTKYFRKVIGDKVNDLESAYPQLSKEYRDETASARGFNPIEAGVKVSENVKAAFHNAFERFDAKQVRLDEDNSTTDEVTEDINAAKDVYHNLLHNGSTFGDALVATMTYINREISHAEALYIDNRISEDFLNNAIATYSNSGFEEECTCEDYESEEDDETFENPLLSTLTDIGREFFENLKTLANEAVHNEDKAHLKSSSAEDRKQPTMTAEQFKVAFDFNNSFRGTRSPLEVFLPRILSTFTVSDESIYSVIPRLNPEFLKIVRSCIDSK